MISRPIYRYGDLDKAASMGAVFGFASNGTNPDALLLIELGKQEPARIWRYGLIQMTTGELTARLNFSMNPTCIYILLYIVLCFVETLKLLRVVASPFKCYVVLLLILYQK